MDLATLSAKLDHLTALLSLQARKLYRLAGLVQVTGIGLRQLQRWDACRFLPGRVKRGRLVLFRAGAIHEWIDRGMPLTKQR